MARMTLRRRVRQFAGDWVSPALTLIGSVLAWELACRLLNVPVWLMPAPSEKQPVRLHGGMNAGVEPTFVTSIPILGA